MLELGLGLFIGIISHYFWQFLRENSIIDIAVAPKILACDSCFSSWVSIALSLMFLLPFGLGLVGSLSIAGIALGVIYVMSKFYWGEW
jgi:hypothetical protein